MSNTVLDAYHVQNGPTIKKIDRLKLFSPDEWEEFTLEWVPSAESYFKCEKLGGAGDKGRDVVAFYTSKSYDEKWDNYQCKHYKDPLMPSKIILEIGKLLHYTYKGDFSIPSNYYFIAPQGVGTSLGDLLKKTVKLREKVVEEWNKECKNKITKELSIDLEGEFRDYVNNFDFNIFSYISPAEQVNYHSKTRHHVERFGGGLPKRSQSITPELSLDEEQLEYVKQLLLGYTEATGSSPLNINSLKKEQRHYLNYQRQREAFYSAEALKAFSRDNVPEGIFELLQKQILDGVIEIAEADYESINQRVIKTLSQATMIQINSNALIQVVDPKDRKGICHQLVNLKKISWV